MVRVRVIEESYRVASGILSVAGENMQTKVLILTKYVNVPISRIS